MKPPDFAPPRYPVYQHIYGGPHAPQVKNAWQGTNGMFQQLLPSGGDRLDPRQPHGQRKGAQSAWPAYQRFGPLELQDSRTASPG